jgi:hypothetical protein
MQHAGTITFVDQQSKCEACAVVRHDEDTVGLALSHKANGDVEVFMTKEDAKKLMDSISRAIGPAIH